MSASSGRMASMLRLYEIQFEKAASGPVKLFVAAGLLRRLRHLVKRRRDRAAGSVPRPERWSRPRTLRTGANRANRSQAGPLVLEQQPSELVVLFSEARNFVFV